MLSIPEAYSSPEAPYHCGRVGQSAPCRHRIQVRGLPNLAGPPAIGLLAASAGLLNSFWLIVALMAAAFAAAPALEADKPGGRAAAAHGHSDDSAQSCVRRPGRGSWNPTTPSAYATSSRAMAPLGLVGGTGIPIRSLTGIVPGQRTAQDPDAVRTQESPCPTPPRLAPPPATSQRHSVPRMEGDRGDHRRP